MKRIIAKLKSNDKNDLFFVVVFFLIITIPLVWFPIKYVLVSSGLSTPVITDNWIFYEKTGTNILGKYEDLVEGTKISIENRVNNYFPFFNLLTTNYYNMNSALNKILYKDDIIFGKNSDGEVIIYNSEGFYYALNKYSDNELEKRYIKQIEFFNDLASNTNLNLSIYLPIRYDLTIMQNRGLYKYLDRFKGDIDSRYNTDYLSVSNNEEYLKYYYKTDHHWNAFGALAGYKDIANLLNINVKTDYAIEQVEGINYYGSMAKSMLSTRLSDNFYDINSSKVMNILSISNGDYRNFKPRIAKVNKNEFYDYYVGYFNGQYGHVKYEGNSSTDRNLLIFSDSFSWQIDYLIAESFNETHVINLRYNEFIEKNFDLNKYVIDNNISDVLFMYEGVATLFDQFDYNIAGRIVF